MPGHQHTQDTLEKAVLTFANPDMLEKVGMFEKKSVFSRILAVNVHSFAITLPQRHGCPNNYFHKKLTLLQRGLSK